MRRCLGFLVLSLLAAGCGGSKSTAPGVTSSARPAGTPPATAATTSGTPSALQGEAASAATGDIPDNQQFVTFTDAKAGYSIKYPEGWAQNGSGNRVTFRDKNNVVRIVVQPGARPTVTTVRSDLAALRKAMASLRSSGISALRLAGAPAVMAVYTTKSAPNPVTGKRVDLTVDRYYLGHAGKRAVVDLGTPVGVDNVDAYRLMIQSFRWR